MGKAIDFGVANIARKVKALDIGIGDTARKVKKVYIGVNDVARLAWASSFEYSYTGRSQLYGDPEKDWELVLFSSGDLNIISAGDNIDIYCCGGGGNGAKGRQTNTGGFGGGGGEGGESVNSFNQSVSEGIHSISIGGAGQNTTAFGITARAGANGFPDDTTASTHNGGNGGAGTTNKQAGNGGIGHLAFDDADTLYKPGYYYGAGGGGGGGLYQDGPVVGTGTPGTGGVSGGISGSAYNVKNPVSAGANSGAGGGGMYVFANDISRGGSGIVIIRNHRGVTA